MKVCFDGHSPIEDLFCISQDEFSLPYQNGRFLYKPPVLRWKIDDDDYSIAPRTIYIKQLTNGSILNVSITLEADDILFMSTGDALQPDSYGGFKLGAALYTYSSKDSERYKDVIIFLNRNGEQYEILHVFMSPAFLLDPLFIESETKSLFFDRSSFIGPSDADLELVILSCDKNEIKRFPLNDGLDSINLDYIDDGTYTFSLVFIKSIAFKKYDEIVFQKSDFLGNRIRYRFKAKAIVLKKIKTFEKPDLRPVVAYRISNISYLKSIDGCDIYMGDLYTPNGQKVETMDDINGDSIKINSIRIEIITDHTCYLGYGLDLEDTTLESYDEFSASYGGNLQVGNGWAKSFGIDYYYFDTEEEHV